MATKVLIVVHVNGRQGARAKTFELDLVAGEDVTRIALEKQVTTRQPFAELKIGAGTTTAMKVV